MADTYFPISDVDIFARRGRYARGVLDQTGAGLSVGELCGRLAAGISLHQRSSARLLPASRGLDGHADVSFFRGRLLVDYFCSCAIGRAGRELPSHGGITVCWRT